VAAASARVACTWPMAAQTGARPSGSPALTSPSACCAAVSASRKCSGPVAGTPFVRSVLPCRNADGGYGCGCCAGHDGHVGVLRSSCSLSCSSPRSSAVHGGTRTTVTCTGIRRWTFGYAEQRTLNPRVRGSSPWRRTRTDLGLYLFRAAPRWPFLGHGGSMLARELGPSRPGLVTFGAGRGSLSPDWSIPLR